MYLYKFYKISTFVVFSTFLLISNFAQLQVFAAGTISITHSATRLPVNSVSDGSISICFVNTNSAVQKSVLEVPKNIKTNTSLEAGNYDYYVTSFTKSSLDGSQIDPCTLIATQYILASNSVQIQDGKSYDLTFTGQGANLEPRGTSIFQNQTPFYSESSTPGVSGAGLYVSYPDFFVDETSTRYNGPLVSTNKVCADNGAAGGVLTSTASTGQYLYFDIASSNVGAGFRIFPPNIDGTCADIFFAPNSMPYVQITNTYNPSGRVFVGFNEGGAITGFSTNINKVIAPKQTTKKLSDFGTQNGWTTQYQYPRGIADLNNDSYDDIYGFGNQGVWVSTNTGVFGVASNGTTKYAGGDTVGTFNPSQNVYAGFDTLGGYFNQDYTPRFIADVNSDGLNDIVGLPVSSVDYVLNGQDIDKTALNFGSFATSLQYNVGGMFGPAGVNALVANANSYSDFNITSGWTDMVKYPRVVTDINGDKYPDIVGFGQDGVWTSLGQSEGRMRPSTKSLNDFGVQQGWTNTYLYPRTLADINGDSFPDIVGFGQKGIWAALNNTAGGFLPSTKILSDFDVFTGWTNSNQFPRFATDLNSDGYSDIVGFGQDGVWVAQNNRQGGFFATVKVLADFNVAGGWTTQYQYPRFIGNVNGTQYADIVGFGMDGVWTNNDFFASYDQLPGVSAG